MIFLGADYSSMGLSPDQIQQRMGKWWTWHEKMEKAGIVNHGEALHPEVRRITGTDQTVTDLAATEVKELVGGYYVIKAANLDEATAVAADFPDYDIGGTVEIREVMVFNE